jgi:hypothetical protein
LLVRAGAKIADISGFPLRVLGIPLYYATPDQVQLEEPGIVVVPCEGHDWQQILDRNATSLDWVPARETIPEGGQLPFDGPIPVLFWSVGFKPNSRPWAAQQSDGSVVFYVDILAATLFMLSRWEETMLPFRDKHARFPGDQSVAYRQGFLDRPIIDEYAFILREWLKVLAPSWEPQPRAFSVKLSHDIDSIRRLASPLGTVRMLAGDLVKRRSPSRAGKTLQQALNPKLDPYYQGIWSLAQISTQYGLGDDAFYFMAATPGSEDCDYDLGHSLIREAVGRLRDEGFEIGLHPSYRTLGNPGRLALERQRLAAILGEERFGGRQHYLRFQVPDTWRHWEQAGLVYDSTMAYADQEGFRCGSCHAFRPFDLEQDRELDLWELPLIVMDGTLFNYRALTPAEGESRILELANRCKAVGGCFTLLWHNTSLSGGWRPWQETYKTVVRKLAKM